MQVMRAYVAPNLSTESERRLHAVTKTLAGLFELFSFLYIGLTLFLVPEAEDLSTAARYTVSHFT